MTPQPTLKERWNYWFDNYMSRGTLALIGGLAVISLVIIFLAAAVISLGGVALAPEGASEPMTFVEAAWEGLMRTMDAGTMGGDAGWGFREHLWRQHDDGHAVTVRGCFFRRRSFGQPSGVHRRQLGARHSAVIIR